jgi:hypothetical protein
MLERMAAHARRSTMLLLLACLAGSLAGASEALAKQVTVTGTTPSKAPVAVGAPVTASPPGEAPPASGAPVTGSTPESAPAAAGTPATTTTQESVPAATGAPVTVTGISPNNGPVAGRTHVTISGSGFVAGSTVRFGSSSATVLSIHSPESITVTSPAGSGTEVVDVTVSNRNGTSAPVAKDQFAYDPAPAAPWLGLDGDSISNAANQDWLGPVNEFSKHGIDYDRSFELTAGQLPSQVERIQGSSQSSFEDRLKYDYEYGMIPVSVIEYAGYDRSGFRFESDPEFPQTRTKAEESRGKNTIGEYVSGFVKSATAIHKLVNQRYPGMQVLFEPMNEPWGYTTPQHNAAEYANVIAQLLPALRTSGVPLSDVYVAASGKGCAKNGECVTNGWVSGMYAAQPKLQSEIEGWYFHPYGPPSGVEDYDDSGIQSLPLVQATMTSGQNNIIVSEVGYCASDVDEGGECAGAGESSSEAEAHLTEMLANARPYREAGWLRALMVYSRSAGGWAMQSFPGKKLTKQGTALIAFARQEQAQLVEAEPSASEEASAAAYGRGRWSAGGLWNARGLWGALAEVDAFTA